MKFRAAAFAAVLALAGAVPADAGDDPSPPAAPAIPERWFRTDWYGIFCEDQQVGWMSRGLARTEYGTIPSIESTVEIHLDVVGSGDDVVTRTVATYRADGAQELFRLLQSRTDQSRSSAREVIRDGATFRVKTTRGGTTVEGAAEAQDLVLADELAVERLVEAAKAREGGPAGATMTVRSFDLGTLTRVERMISVKSAEGEGDDRVFEILAGKETIHADARGGLLDGSLGSRFRFRRMEEASAKDPAVRKSLEPLSRIAMDAKLDPPSGIRSLTVAWDEAVGRVVPQTARQRLKVDGKSLVIEVARDPVLPEATPEELKAALRDDPGLDLAEPDLLKVATAVLMGPDGKDPVSERGQQMDRIAQYVLHRLEKKPDTSNPSALEILRAPAGDCTEHVRLFVALCRAAGIPAREVHGLAWTGDEAGSFGWHLWAEAAPAGRWVAVDPSTGSIPAPATNIAIDPSPEARTMLWRAKFRLVAVERDPAATESGK